MPTPAQFTEILKKRKLKKAFQSQAILYGVDMLEAESKMFDNQQKAPGPGVSQSRLAIQKQKADQT